MPEGPEVNVIKDGLNYHLKGKIITDINLPEGSKFLKKNLEFNILIHLSL